MALRIVDRGADRKPPRPGLFEKSQAEREGLELAVARSYTAVGGELDEQQFIAKLRAARSRVLNPEQMMSWAEEVRAAIRLRQSPPTPVHARIDVATLMELL